MISDYIFVLYLTNGHNLSVDTVLLEVLIDSQMYLNLLDSVHSLVKHMLHLIDLTKTAFTKQLLLVEQSVIPILLKIFRELVIFSDFVVAEN